jgi:hypothetical protein
MENGEWRMENGEWRMENGEWKIIKAQFGLQGARETGIFR